MNFPSITSNKSHFDEKVLHLWNPPLSFAFECLYLQAGVDHKIDLRIAPATETLRE